MALINLPPFTRNTSMADKAGLPPGTVVYVGKDQNENAVLSSCSYSPDGVEEKGEIQVRELFSLTDTAHPVHWFNLDGIHDTDLLQQVGRHFHIHELSQEDIANTQQRPKLEEFDDYLYVILKMLYIDPKSEQIQIEQVSITLGPNWVVTFQEKTEDVFTPIRERIRSAGSRVRKATADYLLFALMDVIISHYFKVVDQFGEWIEELEDDIEGGSETRSLKEIQTLKKDLLHLRKAINPLREVINQFIRSENPLLRKASRKYFMDLRDQVYHVSETLDTYRDMLSNLHDLHLSLSSQRMNEVMKVLTVISTIFIPCSFFAGIYGMNFQYIPELGWKNGYGFFWALMLVITGGLLVYFKRKKWL